MILKYTRVRLRFFAPPLYKLEFDYGICHMEFDCTDIDFCLILVNIKQVRAIFVG